MLSRINCCSIQKVKRITNMGVSTSCQYTPNCIFDWIAHIEWNTFSIVNLICWYVWNSHKHELWFDLMQVNINNRFLHCSNSKVFKKTEKRDHIKQHEHVTLQLQKLSLIHNNLINPQHVLKLKKLKYCNEMVRGLQDTQANTFHSSLRTYTMFQSKCRRVA